MTQRLAYFQAAPEGIKALSAIRPYLNSSSIGKRLKALVDLRCSQINGCAYCVNMHSEEARQAGETQQRLDCLPVWRETTFYDDRERAALAWAESVTLVHETRIPDEPYAEMRKRFNDRELADLTLAIAVVNAWNRLAIGFRSNVPVRK
ncbi:MAG TPA: carboxymuconolactone decarboxylase family protein [Gemmataceae bacterium]|jgi:AhpD family alkylhydroperoxidase|nr:carboxymuconolactone decarboxylase family protein [Gemmataceae bacterium]